MRGRAGGGNQGQRGGARGVRPSPRNTRPTAPTRGQAMRRALVLLVAGVWLALAGIALSGAVSGVSAAPVTSRTGASNLTPVTTVQPTNTPSATATDTPHPGATPTVSVTPSATATKTPTTPPPTATSGDNGGGGGGGSGGDVGPQPTKVVSQLPSSGSAGGGPLGGFGAGAFGSNGLLLAISSSCIVGLLGILIAAIALVVLLRGGYGPFLKALLRGKRAGDKRGKRGANGDLAAAGANTSSSRYGFRAERNAYDGGGWSDPRWDRDDDRPRRRSPSPSRAPSRSRSRGANWDGW